MSSNQERIMTNSFGLCCVLAFLPDTFADRKKTVPLQKICGRTETTLFNTKNNL
jgi:hypothetical protein